MLAAIRRWQGRGHRASILRRRWSLSGLLALSIVVGLPASAAGSTDVPFVRSWGWGVADGQPQLEACTTSCQAGIQGGGAGQLSSGQGSAIATDSSGHVFVLDSAYINGGINNNRISEFGSTGNFIRAWGWGVTDGSAQFEVCTSSCEPGIAGGGAGQLDARDAPSGLATDSAGHLFVSENNNNRISEFSTTGAFIRAWGWGVVDGQSQLEVCTSTCQAGRSDNVGKINHPRGIAADSSGHVFVAGGNVGDSAISEFSSTGDFIRSFGTQGGGGGAGQLDFPDGVAADSSGHVFVSEIGNNRVSEFSTTGAFIRAWGWGVSDGQPQLEVCTITCQPGISGGGSGQLHFPEGVATDSSGHVFVSETSNDRISEFSSAGDFLRAWGWGVADGGLGLETCGPACNPGYYGAGTGQLANPDGVATDSSGDVFVGDSGNSRISEFDGSSQAGPVGGPPTVQERLGGGNPTEFCWDCFAHHLSDIVSGAISSIAKSPIDPMTGNFWHAFNDFSIPGRGIPLSLSRTYNAMAAQTDSPFGFGWSFDYSMSLGFPDSDHVVVTQQNGSTVTFAKQPNGTYAAPPRVEATLIHNGGGTWTFQVRGTMTFTFDSSGKLTTETDRNGYTTSLAYAGGQLSSVTDPEGRTLTFTWTGSHIASVTDPLNRTTSYAYDPAGELTDVTDVAGGNTHFTYDGSHRMLTMRSPNQAPGVPGSTGAVITNTYDGQGRIVSQSDQLGRTTTLAYSGDNFSADGGTTTITDPKGNVSVEAYSFGELTSRTKGYGTPNAATWTFGYDQSTLGASSITDPNGHTTTSTFDEQGNLLSTTDPLGRTTTNTYDSHNDLLTTTDPLGVTTTMTYDANGNLLTRSRPLQGTSKVKRTTYVYGDVTHPGDVTSIKDPVGAIWHSEYNTNGYPISSSDPLGNRETATYNAVGWKLNSVSARGNAPGGHAAAFTTSYSYNAFGELVKTTDALGHVTTRAYDPDQNLIASTDPNGNETHFTYDAADQLTATQRADGTTTQTTYWPDGTIKGQLDASGNLTHYDYDPLARLSAMTDPLGRTTRYSYDGAGNRTRLTDAQGQVTTMAYDSANELTSVRYSDGKTPNVTGLTYDADGQPTGMKDGTGRWSWTWDSLHRLTRVVEGRNGGVQYAYDLDSLPTRIKYPGRRTVTRGYDADGRLTHVTDWRGNRTTFSYDPTGDLTVEKLPARTGVTDRFSYDKVGRVSAIRDSKGHRKLFAASYRRDANGQLSSDSSASKLAHAYRYTHLNQLCYVGRSASSACTKPPTGSTPYQYNSANDLVRTGHTTQVFDAGSQLCWTVARAVTSGTCASPPKGATSYYYDARGNRTRVRPTSGASTTFHYNQANELVTYLHRATRATYAYSGSGLRMAKVVGSTKTGFLWDVADQLPLLLKDGRVGYVYGPDGLPLEQIRGSVVSWLHHDDLGSTRLITNSGGKRIATYRYDPYGNLRASSGSVPEPLRYAGQYQDRESGLYYLRARYYDPRGAQFLSRDPAVGVTQEAYAYAGDNPLFFSDPSGLIPGDCADIDYAPPCLRPSGGAPSPSTTSPPIYGPFWWSPTPAPTPQASTVSHQFCDRSWCVTINGTASGSFTLPDGRRVSFNGCVFVDEGIPVSVGPRTYPTGGYCPPGLEAKEDPNFFLPLIVCAPSSSPEADHGNELVPPL